MTASQCFADLGNASQFKNGRNLAAWLVRTLFIHGARAILARPDKTGVPFGDWLVRLRKQKPFNVACVALANKLARITWAVLHYQQPFNAASLHSESA